MHETTKGDGFDRRVMASELEALGRWRLDARWKGIPSAGQTLTISDVPAQNWNVLAGDLTAPVAILRQSALEANAAWIRKLLVRFGLHLAPHAKTTMSPHLFAHQAEYCWGLTVATAQQAEVAAHFGCRRLILANELIGCVQVHSIIMLLRKHPELVIYLFVDSVSAVHALAANADAQVIMPRLRLLIDVGFAGGRTGCRTVEEAKPILDEISLHKFPMAGIGGYEDLIAAASGEEDASSVERYFDVFQGVASYAETQGHFADGETVLTAGGSSYYDVVGRRLQSLELSRPALRILRSGCYVTHDCGTYHRHNSQMTVRAPQLAKELGDLEPSLFVCGLVQSRPEPNLALITMGKRDVGNDADLPIPVWQFRKGRHNAPQPVPEKWNVFRLNDQHTYLRIGENDDVQVGDLMCFGLSHPCTTFAKWRLTHIVDDDWISVGVLPSVF